MIGISSLKAEVFAGEILKGAVRSGIMSGVKLIIGIWVTMCRQRGFTPGGRLTSHCQTGLLHNHQQQIFLKEGLLVLGQMQRNK